MGKLTLVCVTALMLALTGCKPGAPKQLSKAEIAELGELVTEAQFATMVREHDRAESRLRRAVEIDPDSSVNWLQLGYACRRQQKLDEAKKAYKKALSVREKDFRRNKTAQTLLSQTEVLCLLGREKDARSVQAQAEKKFGSEPMVKAFSQQKMIDRWLADPSFRELAL